MRSDSRKSSDNKTRTAASVMIPRLLLIGCVVMLVVIGLVMIYSASSVEAYSDYGDAMYFLKRQSMMLALGLVPMAVVIALPFQIWNRNVLWGIWTASVLLLVVTDIFGFVGLGAQRWLYIGPIGFQPSEFTKIATLLLVAYQIVEYRSGSGDPFMRFLLKMLASIAIPAALILIQPDLGTTIILLVGVIAVLWFGEISRKLILGVLGVVIILALIAIFLVGFRSTRISSWLDPWSDPYYSGYQIINSFYAFSEGGIFGVGLGNSTQKYLYLPYAYNDFIFAIIGEELGLFGATAVILLFLVFLLAAFRIGRMSSSGFGMMVCNSMASTIVFQAFLNIACVIGVLPITGKPLPFISYGGSSIISTLMMVGFMISVSRHCSADETQRRRSQIRSYAGGGGPAGPPSRVVRGQALRDETGQSAADGPERPDRRESERPPDGSERPGSGRGNRSRDGSARFGVGRGNRSRNGSEQPERREVDRSPDGSEGSGGDREH